MKTALIALVLIAEAAGQAPPTARLGGTVVEDGSAPARPVRRAIVTITGTSISTHLQVITDDDGRFVAANLPAGRFSITVEKPTYVKSYYGSARVGRPPGMPIALAAGQSLANLTVPLMRGAAIGGVVTDSAGTPLPGTQVLIRLVTIVNGDRRFVSPQGGVHMLTTDDRGAYRAWGLPPGEYVVRAGGGTAGGIGAARVASGEEISAALRGLTTAAPPPAASATTPGVATTSPLTPQPPPPITRLATFFPNAVDPLQAQGVRLGAGDDRDGVNIAVQIGRVGRIAGTSLNPTGQPATNMSVGLANLSTGSMFISMGGIRSSAAGEFGIGGLQPGRWLLFGRGAEAGTPSDGRYPWWAETEVVMAGQDVVDVVLRFLPGSTVTGRIVFEGSESKPDMSRLRVSLSYVAVIDGLSTFVQPVTPRADGTFTFENVPPGRYRPSISAAGAWALKSAIADGREVLDTPMQVVTGQDASLTMSLTDRPTEISGMLLDQLGRPAPEYSVVVFSADRAMWTVSPRRTSGIVRLGTDGRYRITGLPAGDYVLCVITDADPASLNDVSFLEELARVGIPIKLAEGEKKTQDFKIGG